MGELHTNPTETQRLFSAIDTLTGRVELVEESHVEVVRELRDNTAVTVEVRDILQTIKSFRVVGGVVKTAAGWVSSVGGGVAIVYELAKWVHG
jgi:hypothetical protein